MSVYESSVVEKGSIMLDKMKVLVVESNGAKYELKVNSICSLKPLDGEKGYRVEFSKRGKYSAIVKFLLEDWNYCKLVFSECVLMEGERKLR